MRQAGYDCLSAKAVEKKLEGVWRGREKLEQGEL